MIVLDTLLWGGVRFVLNQVIEAVDAELNDEDRLREELLAAQMRVELGELTDAQFTELETAILQRLREIRQAREQATDRAGDFKVTGIDAEVTFDVPETVPTPPVVPPPPAEPVRGSASGRAERRARKSARGRAPVRDVRSGAAERSKPRRSSRPDSR
jgi:hypothetical protein